MAENPVMAGELVKPEPRFRRLPRQACLSRLLRYQDEMADVACKLVADCATTVRQIRWLVRNFIIFTKESNNGRCHRLIYTTVTSGTSIRSTTEKHCMFARLHDTGRI